MASREERTRLRDRDRRSIDDYTDEEIAAEIERLRNDPEDVAACRRVMADMDAIRADWPDP